MTKKTYNKLVRDLIQEVIEPDSSKNLDSTLDIQFQCVGIDACKGKWLAVAIGNHGFEVNKYDTIGEICEKYVDCDYMIIDIPLGLRDSSDQKRPDSIVKKMLGRKGSSIFEVPCRKAIYATTKEEARSVNIQTLGKSLSEQSIGFSKAIRQVDEFLISNDTWKNRLLESHPEFCFMKLNDGKAIMEKKITAEGQELRLSVLEKQYPRSREVVNRYLSDIPSRKKVDDVIDALSLAVMGKLMIQYGMKTIPLVPESDQFGIMMQMVFWGE